MDKRACLAEFEESSETVYDKAVKPLEWVGEKAREPIAKLRLI